MSITVTKEGDVIVLAIDGQLLLGNRHELKQKALDELARGATRFRIDLRQTGYIDSSGLGALVTLSKAISERGGEMRLANVTDEHRSLFTLTNLQGLLQLSDESAAETASRVARPPRPPGPLRGPTN
jgi:anti-sigma B factor antagonist